MSTNQQYKSSVFSLLFGEKDKLLELYNAIEEKLRSGNGDRDKHPGKSIVHGPVQ